MAVFPATPENIARAAAVLRDGGIVAFPTETVYGLGADAFNPAAVARIFEAKQRPSFDPLIVHIADAEALEAVALEFNEAMLRLSARFWPGPLTIVTRKTAAVPALVTAGLATVAVRMPAHPVARELIRLAGTPVAAPSANPFGAISPTRAEHVMALLGDRVDLILDGGPTEHGLESTIVAVECEPAILRYGAVPREEIERIIGPVIESTAAAEQPQAPGQLSRHYAPRVPLRIVDFAIVPEAERPAAGALAFGEIPSGYRFVRNLSASGDLREAAVHLFDYLHELGALSIDRIDAAPMPAMGLGRAINDRLVRAAGA
jgi:L-threonylcarbamoyladenylate synthase